MVKSLCEKKKFRPHVIDAIMESPLGDVIKQDIQLKMYKSVQDKFVAWKCLLHLDLTACVSYHEMDVIQKLEFYGTDDAKYNRGIFQERSKLPQISRQLERHGETMVPFVLTNNSVTFDTSKATMYLLKDISYGPMYKQTECASSSHCGW